MRTILAIMGLLLLFSLPPSSAQKDDPTTKQLLTDPLGDVHFGYGYVGSKDRAHIDLDAAWVEYDTTSDVLGLVMRVQDASWLAEPEPNWGWWCGLYAYATREGEVAGRFGFTVGFSEGRFGSGAAWYEQATEGPIWSLEGASRPIPHDFRVHAGRPGLVTLDIPRGELLLHGDGLEEPYVTCREWPLPSLAGATYNPFMNENLDDGTSDGSLRFSSFQPQVAADIPDEPWAHATWVAPAGGLLILIKVVIVWWQYARLAKHKVLENPIRSRLHEFIRAEPGIHHRELLRRSQLAPGSLAHHLYILERASLIQKLAFHGFTRYFTREVDARSAKTRVALSAENARWIFEQARGHPGVTATELANIRGLQPSSILYHVRRLVQAGLLERRRTDRGLGLFVPAAELAKSSVDVEASA